MLSPLHLKIAAATETDAISDSLRKLHTHIDGTDWDAALDLYTASAVQWAEGYMHRSILSRSHEWGLLDFPRWHRQEIRLPRGKTQSVESIAYVRNGVTTTLTGPSSGSPAGTDWQEDLRDDDGALLMPPRGEDWPSTDDDVPTPVLITFTAGWAAADIPEQIKHALALAIADAFTNRGDVETGDTLSARQALLSGWCLSRLY